ncbi:uncharacterized protein PITG_20825 [Phytophthora infestans T30-4]|uniref:Acetyl-coenzyme A synthetase N-terminal domain-containing protein n=1 Tax=Phytophthora infestans (strain T30-4) TaxID=403677 RepID=D0P2V8_PHYIT|nr:uncharacterized protein PITG_20825 [Phytophthora infestans T30-4]EEY57095.1 conserved hypothetical protein [Phytophthora infestans T30-4]|eukprot:XP_002895372.1 conserved hypothetical protein [Phytophthora infestans T30-4]
MVVLGKRKGDTVPSTDAKRVKDGATLWSPSADLVAFSNWTKFSNLVNERFKLSLKTPQELWQWSVDNLEDFWGACWDFTGMVASQPYTKVIEDKEKMPGSR